jgi:hypothetical protein
MSYSETKITSICFYFPYYEDSGVPVLFHRLANYIANHNQEIVIYLIDYKNGSMARHLLKLPNIHLIIFKDGEKVAVPDNTILIMQAFLPYKWPYELQLKDNTRLFFWNLHPRNIVPSLLPFFSLTELPTTHWWVYRFVSLLYPVFLQRLKKYANLLFKNSAYYFMDITNYESTVKYLYLKWVDDASDFIIPIPVTLNTDFSINKELHKDNIRFCWVGRLCDFKAHILVYTINKLGDISKQHNIKITYYIIGDGSHREYIEKNINAVSNIEVVFCGTFSAYEVHNFLCKNVDVLTAMGTSALEGAQLRIPTILLDYSYKKITKDYNFRFLYETIGCDLGHQISKLDFQPKNKSLEDILSKLSNEYWLQADKTYQYYLTNHTIDSVVDKFLMQISKTTLTYSMIDKSYFKKSWALWLHDLLHPLYERIIGRTSNIL